MVNATRLAQHVLTLEPEKDEARLCLYNFLKNLCDGSEVVDSALINRFLRRALTYPHWQEHIQQLFKETYLALHTVQSAQACSIDTRGLLTPERVQPLPALKSHVAAAFIQRAVESASGEPARTFNDRDRQWVAVQVRPDRSLVVRTFPPQAMIIDGALEPACSDDGLLYNGELQLRPQTWYTLVVAPHTLARFQTGPDGCRGQIMRGYSLQKMQSLDGGPIHRYPLLFYAIKRLEQFFINRKTDPMYLELVGLLEKGQELLVQEHPEALRFAEAAVERGNLAFANIFPDDHLIHWHLQNLQEALRLRAQAKPATNSGLTEGQTWETIHPLKESDLTST